MLNGTYGLNSTKGNNSKIKLKTCRTIVSKHSDEDSGHLHIETKLDNITKYPIMLMSKSTKPPSIIHLILGGERGKTLKTS